MPRETEQPSAPIGAGDAPSAVATPRRWRGWLALALCLAPSVAIVALSPGFVTQDGPAHLYNAHILAESIRPDSPFRSVFAVRLDPLPNWLGTLAEMGLVATLPPLAADRLMTLIPLIGLSAATFWLKGRVSGPRGDLAAAPLAAMIGLNVCWLFGFTSFLLGACLLPIALGVWWDGRARFGPRRAAVLAGLLVLGYFAHIVSLGLTIGSLMVLAVLTPGPGFRLRGGWTAAALSPCLMLGLVYRRIMRQGGPLRPDWGHLRDPLSLDSWREQIGWIDPISLGRKGALPFLPGESAWAGLLTPAALMAAGVAVLVLAHPRIDRERLAWPVLAIGLLLAGLVTPDPQGEAHGNYLPQRVMLGGLIAVVGWLDFGASRRLAPTLLAGALMLQTLTLADYARESSARVGPFLKAREAIGHGRRIGTGLVENRARFRSNPLLHADNLLGVGTGNIIWADYETHHYYFPVQVRGDVPHPPARPFEQIARKSDPADAAVRAKMLGDLLDAHHAEIDLWVAWGHDAAMEAILARWFDPQPVFEDGALRVLKHR